MKLLAADIGGTKVRLALATPRAAGFDLAAIETYPSTAYPTLDGLIRHYLDKQGARVDAAGLAVPGPVTNGTATLTNLPWTVASGELATALGLDSVSLLNDLEGLAWSISLLTENSLETLQSGEPGIPGNRALIAAGTGLGQALLVRSGEDYLPTATEGGHCDFAPADDFDYDFHRYLGEHWEHVSWERVLSGPGLAAIYRFLLHREKIALPTWFAGLAKAEQPAAVSHRALAGDDALATEAMRVFVIYYGREAGNLGLKVKATGGVYIGGGVAPKIMSALRQPAFIGAFNAKGRMRALMTSMPVRVILDDSAALIGIARYAQRALAT